jgi:uncharacterized protein (TIGR02145 family)
MRKLIKLILGIALVYSCSTSNDGNGNSTTTVVPFAPSNLTGTVASTTQINLSWTDNSTNETGFKIERKTGIGTYSIIGTTATDVTTFNDTGLSQGTTYTYRVYSNNAVGNSLTYSNEITLSTTAINQPTLTTTAVSSITTVTAISGGTISSDGGASISARGVCWSTSANPTIALSTKTNDGSGAGLFISSISGLTANTTYYVRAFATNSQGTAYGNELSFVTQNININPLPTVTIGLQIWQSTNLDVTTYRDGTPIPQVTDPTAWVNLITGAWCYYNNDPVNGTIYGKLYNWYAVAGIHDTDPNTPNKILAPTGWHVPSSAEWANLTTFLGGDNLSGGKMKSTGTSLWQSPNTNATNSSGFTGIPGGFRLPNGAVTPGEFIRIGIQGNWWSSSEDNTPFVGALGRLLFNDNGSCISSYGSKNYGLSVRCVRD